MKISRAQLHLYTSGVMPSRHDSHQLIPAVFLQHNQGCLVSFLSQLFFQFFEQRVITRDTICDNSRFGSFLGEVDGQSPPGRKPILLALQLSKRIPEIIFTC